MNNLSDCKVQPVVLPNFGAQPVALPDCKVQLNISSDHEAWPVAPPECRIQPLFPSAQEAHLEAPPDQEQLQSMACNPAQSQNPSGDNTQLGQRL